jgi:hypothetical protein
MNALPETNRIGNVVNGISRNGYPFNSYIPKPKTTPTTMISTNFVSGIKFSNNNYSDFVYLGYLYLYPPGSVWSINYAIETPPYYFKEYSFFSIVNSSNSAIPTYLGSCPIFTSTGIINPVMNQASYQSKHYGGSCVVVVGNQNPNYTETATMNYTTPITATNYTTGLINNNGNLIQGVNDRILYNYALAVRSPNFFISDATANTLELNNVTLYAVRLA